MSQWGYGSDDEYRIVLIGKTGAGKSSTGNSLLNEKKFFENVCAQSVTKRCERATGERNNGKLVVVDTPGLFDTMDKEHAVLNEIMKCIAITSPGPHVVVLVLRLHRITPEEKYTIDCFLEYFGKPVLNYMIIVFTNLDDIEYEGISLSDWVANGPTTLKDVLTLCGNRYIGFNNNAEDDIMLKQVDSFFTMVDEVIKQNGGSCYTNDMFQEMERFIRTRMDIFAKEQEDNMKHEIGELERRYNARQLSGNLSQMSQFQQINARQLREQVRAEMEKNEGGILLKIRRILSVLLKLII